jgi:predicted RNA polymerase sigma factor
MAGYYLWDAVVGDLLYRAGRPIDALEYLTRALAEAPSEAERALLRRRLGTCRREADAGR